MKMSYPLYHTLNRNISSGGLSKKQERELVDSLNSVEDSEIKEAIIMLIAEHARVNEELNINEGQLELPFGMRQKGKVTSFNFEDLPSDLKLILWKFMNRK